MELRERPNDSITARLIDYAAHETPAWTDKRLRDIIVTLLIAGHETSVVAYAWATQYLLHNPHPRAELVAEAREARTDRYAHACNTEALRMQSPVIGTLPFPLTEDIALGGYRIPRSTMVFAAASALHHDEDLYPEPEAFRPERWFQTTPDRYGYIPFGVGVHRCPGSTFYFTEAAILLHRLFGRLDLEPCDPSVDPARFIFGVVARPRGNTRVIVRQRRNAEDVPWYRPVENEKPSPLKQALLPDPPETAEPAHCPFAPDSHTSGEG
ncbi:cytochrome P450 [Nocardia sputorum]|uniref:Cytochrome P450 n=1 Tax=Nocardia sputorum TaxID=2984338 RepID=A0ABN6U262_9NOCA|nr:cytochrome P450 [Nocardia sputorum]BDT99291.1 hypothetical protein IFM12276_23200 [Nocardia sputorum]